VRRQTNIHNYYSRYQYDVDVVEKQKAKRCPRIPQTRPGRLLKPPASTDDSSISSVPKSSSNQSVALALGLGPRFNWLENKINTMQTGTTTTKQTLKPRPLLPKPPPPSVTGTWCSLDSGSSGVALSTVVVVATMTTTTSSTMSLPQTSVPVSQHDVITSQSSVNVG